VLQHYSKKTAKGNYYYTALKESVINKETQFFYPCTIEEGHHS
jgi:hypothetical protein